MSLYSSYATDPELEKNGVIVTYPDLDRKMPEAVRIRLARLTGRSSRYKQVREKLLRPYPRMKFEDLPQDTQDQINRQLFVEAVILSWETKHYEGCKVADGVQLKDGWYKGVELHTEDGLDVIVPSTVENLCAALKLAPDFANALTVDASDSDLYRVQRREDDSGN